MWHSVLGHDDVVEQFRRALARGRLASSFLFAGPAGVGKRTFALKLAQALLCQTRPEEAMDPCETCSSCAQVAAQTHPDLQMIAKPTDKAFIPLELLIGDREHRGREGLCHNIAMKPYLGGRKVAILDDADYLNAEGANSLLKTLEEPPPRSVLILIGTSPAKQLPTIRSRCQLIRFNPLPLDVVEELLVSRRLVEDAGDARRLAVHSEGSLQRAMDLSDPALWSFRDALFELLSQPRMSSAEVARMVSAFVDEAGKEASARRARLKNVIGLAADFYRSLLRSQAGAGLSEAAELQPRFAAALASGNVSADLLASRLDRCLDAAAQVERNANQSTLIEAWIDDLARS